MKMKKILKKNADNLALIVGFCVCIGVGYYIGVERSFSAFSTIMKTDVVF
jgi:hypothetical protein